MSLNRQTEITIPNGCVTMLPQTIEKSGFQVGVSLNRQTELTTETGVSLNRQTYMACRLLQNC